jgi:hypothetical protein
MDLSGLSGVMQSVGAAIGIDDVSLVIGIIVIFALVRYVLTKIKKPIIFNDWISRIIVLGLGVACAFIKVDYKDSIFIEITDLIGKAFAYGGAATIAYQLAKPLLKKIFPDKDIEIPGDDKI